MTRFVPPRRGVVSLAVVMLLGVLAGCNTEPIPVRPASGLGVNPVGGGLAFVSLSAGGGSACGLIMGGAGYCWGAGSDQVDSYVPIPLSGGFSFIAISVATWDTCGLTIGGTAMCWGASDLASVDPSLCCILGQLGLGPGAPSQPGVPVVEGQFVALTASDVHTCGLTQTGVAYCWGWNGDGELGNGSTVDSSLVPVAVSGGLVFTSLSARGRHTCGLTPTGAAYCWGNNFDGALGVGTVTGPQVCGPAHDGVACSQTPVAVTGGLRFATISAGSNHTCGVTPAGAAYCWGANTSGQVGSGSTMDSVVSPVAVSTSLQFAMVSAGFAHTCGVTTEDRAYCWGDNGGGQLGDSLTTVDSSRVPVAVSSAVPFSTISAGVQHTCALSISGEAYCWGTMFGCPDVEGPRVSLGLWTADTSCAVAAARVAPSAIRGRASP